MKLKYIPFVAILIALSSNTSAEDWTDDEQELLEWEESCVAATDFDTWIGCFHEDFVGWGWDYPVPQTKSERGSLNAEWFERNDSELMLFKPLSAEIFDDTAVINSVATYRIVDKRTGEVTIETSMWTDVCIKDDGQWYWIADHGTLVSDD